MSESHRTTKYGPFSLRNVVLLSDQRIDECYLDGRAEIFKPGQQEQERLPISGISARLTSLALQYNREMAAVRFDGVLRVQG